MIRTARAIGLFAALTVLSACDDRRGVSPKAPVSELTAGPGLLASVQLPSVRISEFHYDNGTTDVEEKVEISGPAGTSLDGWKLYYYNGRATFNASEGNPRAPYDSTILNGLTIPATCGARGVVVVQPIKGVIQDGSPDGMALVNGSTVVDLISYEGTFVGISGVATDRTFPDIGVRELGSEGTSPAVRSLKRTSTNTWLAPSLNDFGTCNDNTPPAPQVIDHISVSPAATSVQVGQTQQLTATAFEASDAVIFDVSFSWQSSDPLTASIDANGLVTTFRTGDVTFTATTPNSVTNTATLHVDAAGLSDIRFSELHYDFPNTNQSVEVEALGSKDFDSDAGWMVVFYDGDNGKQYMFRDLIGTIDPDTCGRSYEFFGLGSLMQKGSPDGIALIKPADVDHPYPQVVEFLSYEGSFTATDGPADGKRSVDIGKAEIRNLGGSANSLQRLRDGSGWYGPQQNTLGVCNNDPTLPPVAAVDGPYTSSEGSPVAMSAAASTAPSGNPITNYQWTFGEGGTATGVSVSHTYMQQGTYDVSLTVTDSKGLQSTALTTTTVGNIAPALSALSGATLIVGDTYTASGSFTDPGADIWTATVDYGDGTSGPLSLSGKSFSLSHVYSAFGTFTVTVSVSDGLVTSSSSASVLVHARPIGSVDGPFASTEGAPVAMSATASTDPDGSIQTYSWTFGDGATSAGAAVAHTYVQNGSYSVTLTVTDNDGLTTVTTTTATVTNVAPTISDFVGATISRGETYTASGSFTDPGADSWAATVNYGDGSGAPALSLNDKNFELSHTYGAFGTFIVTVTVDDGTATSTKSNTVRVLARPAAAVNGPFTSNEGASVAMSGASSVDEDGIIQSYVWDFGDGTTGSGAGVSHVYLRDGSYAVTLRVTDNDGLASSAATTVTVANVAPVIADFAGGTQFLGETYSVSGSFADPGDDSWSGTVNYGDGTGTSALALTGRSFSLSHVYSRLGRFTVTVTVFDGAQTSTRTQTVAVLARPVGAVNGPYTSNEGASMAMSAAASSDADGTIQSYAWTFGDGATGSGVSVSHVYVQDGSYTVALTVTDNDGLTNVATTTVTVANVAPAIAVFPGATNLFVGDTYSASGSFTDPGADTWTATADYGDGASGPLALSGKNFTLSHEFSRPGTFSVVVIVSDGRWTGSRSALVKVVARPVAVIGGTYSSTEGASIAINGTGSSDADGTIQSYLWNFGDGSTASGVSVSHTYPQDGAFVVTLTVTDNDGLTATTTTTVQIANVAPVISALPDRAILQGERYTAQGFFTDPGNDSWTATVNYGDGPTSALALSGKAFALSHTYATGGTFTVTVQVSDDDGTSVRTATVSVMNVAEVLRYVLENSPDINTMENRIQSAIKQYAMGKSNLTSTISHLNGFLDEMDKAMRTGAITPQEGAPLRDLIQRVVNALSGQAQSPVAAAPVPVTPAPAPGTPPTGPRTPTAGPRSPGSIQQLSAPSNQMPVPSPLTPVPNAWTPAASPKELGPSSGRLSAAEAASLWRIILSVIAAAGR